jgi:hypothetical protein
MVSKGGVVISGPTLYLLWVYCLSGSFGVLTHIWYICLLSLVMYRRSDVLGASFWWHLVMVVRDGFGHICITSAFDCS